MYTHFSPIEYSIPFLFFFPFDECVRLLKDVMIHAASLVFEHPYNLFTSILSMFRKLIFLLVCYITGFRSIEF